MTMFWFQLWLLYVYVSAYVFLLSLLLFAGTDAGRGGVVGGGGGVFCSD